MIYGFCLSVPIAVEVSIEVFMVILNAILMPFFIPSFDKGPSSHQVLPLDEQKWWLGMDANQGISHSTSYKPRAETNVVFELYCQVSICRDEDVSNLVLASSTVLSSSIVCLVTDFFQHSDCEIEFSCHE